MDAVTRASTWCFSASPTTPPGRSRRRLVQKLLRRCADCGAVLVVDECFLDFLPTAGCPDAKKLLASPNLIILKAFTKLYAMAGVRLGYCLCGNTALLDKMQAAGQPWAVSSLAQAAGLAALGRPPMPTACAPHCRAAPKLAAGCGHWGCGCGRQRQLSAVPRTGNAGRGPAAARRRAAQLRQLPGAGRQLVPHRRAHRAGKPTAVENLMREVLA